MSNRNELRRARRRLADAQANLDRIMKLPRRIGARVVWSNDIIWTRVGDDQWEPRSPHQPEGYRTPLYTSSHVASGQIVEQNQ